MTDNHTRFAVISAVYNVNRYLADYFNSLDRQTIAHQRIKVVIVDDGSTDGSGAAIDSWAERTDLEVLVVHQENSGQGAARNAGLAHLDDVDWVTFVDPDDFLAPDYFERIADFIDTNPTAALVAGHQQDFIDDGRATQVDRHPLRYRFAGGDQLVDIDRFPRFILLGAAATFFRVTTLLSLGLKFDPRIRPNFEDGHLVNKYLLHHDARIICYVASAKYNYRRRADGTSTLQNASSDPRKYTDVLRYGYCDLLDLAQNMCGKAPYWLQYTIIYELTWTFRGEESMFSATAGLDHDTCAEFHSLVAQIRRALDPVAIEGFNVLKRTMTQREALLHGYSEEDWRWPVVRVDQLDAKQGLVRLRYRYTGTPPEEQFYVRGLPTPPKHSKTRHLTFLKKALVYERVAWVWANGDLAVTLDGEPVPLTFDWPEGSTYTVSKGAVRRRRLQPTPSPPASGSRPKRSRLPGLAGFAETMSRTKSFRRLFKDAWVLMDRKENAHDNAEHLFRYLRKSRRDINAWFVVEKDSSDWARLKRDGYKRLVAHGSLLWRILCLNATHIVSSHADRYVYHPFDRSSGPWCWNFSFLQHGIIKDDLSRWLNPKPISLMLTSTKSEHASIAGEGSEYQLTTKEAVLTGLPRHDRLHELALRSTARLILIMPTWRHYLFDYSSNGGDRAPLTSFGETAFAARWQEFLSSSRLEALAEELGLEVVFMPHPNLSPYLSAFSLNSRYRTASYEHDDVQEMLASAALVITDYSSLAIEAAAIRRPVVYYQFDREEVFGGGHTTRPGYFDYDRDGFGPVCASVDELVSNIEELLREPGQLQQPYRERVDATIEPLDGNASKRVTRAILSMEQKLSRADALRPVPTPPNVQLWSE